MDADAFTKREIESAADAVVDIEQLCSGWGNGDMFLQHNQQLEVKECDTFKSTAAFQFDIEPLLFRIYQLFVEWDASIRR